MTQVRNFSYEQHGVTTMDKLVSYLRYKKVNIALKKNVGDMQNMHFCDVGCGYNANFLRYIHDHFPKTVLYGVDLFIDDKIDFIRRSITDLEKPEFSIKDNSIDVITSLAVIEHLYKPDAYLQEIKRVLKPGGTLILTTPSLYAKPVLETFAHVGISTKEEVLDHKIYYTKKTLATLISGYFDDFSITYFQLGMNILLVVKKK